MSDRFPAPWMVTLDERIIEYVAEEPLASPGLMSVVISVEASERRIRERCRMLADAELIAPISEDFEMYEVTSEGMRYLDGELDVEHQPRPNPRAEG